MKSNILLPSQVFFNPNNKFLDWAKQFKKNLIVDCGAGIGRLSSLLKNNNHNVMAIDLYEREKTETFILIKDSTTFEFPKKSIAIIARPNRGQWIHKTIFNALKACSCVLYIGIEEHIEEDIDTLRDDNLIIKRVFDNAGDNNETVYQISKEEKTMKTKYYLVQTFPTADPIFSITSWREEDGNKWTNFNGGWCPKSKKDKVLEIQEAEDIHELDWTKTSLIDNRNSSGWLNREGTFYGCNSQNHDLVADLVFNKTVEEMENEGWVRVYNSDECICMKPMSPEQRNYLLNKGYKISESD